ncbi:MAG: aldo/keto reductase [Firmicutes bacterium]|nr:aldo/keto reductase [Bacillota bacterium]
MRYRSLGSTGIKVSEISFGTWAIGGSWGNVEEQAALDGLARAMDQGVTFFDTADVYGDGRAERLLARATKGRDIAVATKFCRAGDIHDPATYTYESVSRFCEGSLKRLEREAIDLYQIHCPPHAVLEQGDVFAVLDRLKREGKILHYGVSVETDAEGLTALRYPGVEALQVIFNVFRQKPITELFPVAKEKNAGILVRLPLASGLLTGKFRKDDSFPADDHRNFNQNGESFNVGETFAGLPFPKGVELAERLRWIGDGRGNMTRAALRYILDYPEVSCVIPGFKNVQQVDDNLATEDVPSFTAQELAQLSAFYETEVKPWIRGPY